MTFKPGDRVVGTAGWVKDLHGTIGDYHFTNILRVRFDNEDFHYLVYPGHLAYEDDFAEWVKEVRANRKSK